MLLFSRFLVEEEHKMNLASPDKHIPHLSDSILHNGHKGVHGAAEALDDGHHMMTGGTSKHEYTRHIDGTPVIFGMHPHSGKFFVSTPKGKSGVNYTPEDVVNNHANNPKLAAQMIAALHELPKIMPKESHAGLVFQGNHLHTPDSIIDKDNHYHFKPNQMVLSAKHDSPEGKLVRNSKYGIMTHTMFDPQGVAMPIDKKTRNKFVNHPDVHNMDNKAEGGKYDSADMGKFLKHRDAATKLYRTMKPEAMDVMMTHAPDIVKHINDQISKGEPYDSKSLLSSLTSEHGKRMGGISNEKWKRQRTSDHASKTTHLLANEINVDKALKLHKHINDASEVIAKGLDSSNPWIHSYKGQITPPEGTVATPKNGESVKYVQRKEMAKAMKKAGKSKDDK